MPLADPHPHDDDDHGHEALSGASTSKTEAAHG
jgi:hypothetical protein